MSRDFLGSIRRLWTDLKQLGMDCIRARQATGRKEKNQADGKAASAEGVGVLVGLKSSLES